MKNTQGCKNYTAFEIFPLGPLVHFPEKSKYLCFSSPLTFLSINTKFWLLMVQNCVVESISHHFKLEHTTYIFSSLPHFRILRFYFLPFPPSSQQLIFKSDVCQKLSAQPQGYQQKDKNDGKFNFSSNKYQKIQCIKTPKAQSPPYPTKKTD